MKITASAISLNVDDVAASAMFIKQHFGFSKEMSADGFVSLSKQDAGFNLIFLRTGLETMTTGRHNLPKLGTFEDATGCLYWLEVFP